MLSIFNPTFLGTARVAIRAESRCLTTTAGLWAARKKQSLDYPAEPKKPAGAYNLFMKTYFAENKHHHTNSEDKVDLKSILTATSNAWKDLSSSDKQPYTTTAKELKKTYDQEYRSWYDSLSPGMVQMIEVEKGKELSKPGGKVAFNAAEKEAAKAAGLPVKPLTAFFEFMREYRGSNPVVAGKVTDQAKGGAAAWNKLSESEKQAYKDTYKERKAAYDEAMGIEKEDEL